MRKCLVAQIIGNRPSLLDIGHHNIGARNHGARWINHRAKDRSGNALAKRQGNAEGDRCKEKVKPTQFVGKAHTQFLLSISALYRSWNPLSMQSENLRFSVRLPPLASVFFRGEPARMGDIRASNANRQSRGDDPRERVKQGRNRSLETL
jgi:hypothetical protein